VRSAGGSPTPVELSSREPAAALSCVDKDTSNFGGDRGDVPAESVRPAQLVCRIALAPESVSPGRRDGSCLKLTEDMLVAIKRFCLRMVATAVIQSETAGRFSWRGSSLKSPSLIVRAAGVPGVGVHRPSAHILDACMKRSPMKAFTLAREIHFIGRRRIVRQNGGRNVDAAERLGGSFSFGETLHPREESAVRIGRRLFAFAPFAILGEQPCR
jgi:hypothetical protein